MCTTVRVGQSAKRIQGGFVSSIWQQLGAFVSNVGNCGTDRLDKFAQIGGKWICVNLYNDDVDAEPNRKALPGFRAQCTARGIAVYGWFNGHGEEPVQQAKEMAGLASNLNLTALILDLEAEYQNAGAEKMPLL